MRSLQSQTFHLAVCLTGSFLLRIPAESSVYKKGITKTNPWKKPSENTHQVKRSLPQRCSSLDLLYQNVAAGAYRWVPLYSNMLNPNSHFIRSPVEIALLSLQCKMPRLFRGSLNSKDFYTVCLFRIKRDPPVLNSQPKKRVFSDGKVKFPWGQKICTKRNTYS